MENVFLHLFNLSITASYMILAVIILRFVLAKAPKWVNCLLWSIVGLRLLVPFSIESIFSLVPSPEPIPSDIMISPEPQINTGIPAINNTFNPIIADTLTPDPTASANPLQILLFVVSIIWIVGVATILLWGLISYLRLKKRVAPSIHFKDNIYYCDDIDTPFVLGIFRPRIYLPSNIDGEVAHQVIAHEKAHVARLDHIFKPLGYLLLSVYWFSPLVWIAYILFCRDVEGACDERVIRDMCTDERQKYSAALLSCSVSRAGINACPLAFGEVGVKSRVKSILSYKKPAFWIIVAAVVASVAIAVGFLTNPIDKPTMTVYGETDPDKLNAAQIALMERYPELFGLNATNGLDVYVCQYAENSYSFTLLEHSETPHIAINDTTLHRKSFVTISAMRVILESYDIPEDQINIIPWQDPLSSYIGPYWIIFKGESPEEKQANYKKMMREMLFSDEPFVRPTYMSMQFDIDSDGNTELCILGFGMTTDRFSFTLSAAEITPDTVSSWRQKYDYIIYSDVYTLSFVKGEDGVVRIQGIDLDDKTHLFDISFVDGNLSISENGVSIGEIISCKTYPTQ